MTPDAVEESGLRLGFPAGQSFRFQQLTGYRRLSGQSLKEMDFAWHHKTTLYLLEVRDYRDLEQSLHREDLVPTDHKTSPYRFRELVDKVTDSLMMLLAARAKTKRGQSLAAEMPDYAKSRTELRLIIALGLPPNLRVHLTALRHAINARLRGRIALADVAAVSVLDYEHLRERAPQLGLDCQVLPSVIDGIT